MHDFGICIFRLWCARCIIRGECRHIFRYQKTPPSRRLDVGLEDWALEVWQLMLELDVVNTIQLIMRLLLVSSRYVDGIYHDGLDQSVSYLGTHAVCLLVESIHHVSHP